MRACVCVWDRVCVCGADSGGFLSSGWLKEGGGRWSEERGKGGTFAEGGGAFGTVDKNVFDRQNSIACLSGLCTISAPLCCQAHHRSLKE